MVAIAIVAAGIVVGFLLGGIGPRVEVQERDERIAGLERQLEAADTGRWRSPVPGLDRILRGPEDTELPRVVDAPPPVEDDGTSPAEPENLTDGGVVSPRWRQRWNEGDPTDRLAAFRRAASVQRVRRVQSRAALRQQADLDDEEMARVDTALTEMNEALYGHGEELLMLGMSGEPPPARDLLGITHDVTGILHRAQLQLEDVVGAERASEVDSSALEIWNHVDLGQLEPAARAALRAAP